MSGGLGEYNLKQKRRGFVTSISSSSRRCDTELLKSDGMCVTLVECQQRGDGPSRPVRQLIVQLFDYFIYFLRNDLWNKNGSTGSKSFKGLVRLSDVKRIEKLTWSDR